MRKSQIGSGKQAKLIEHFVAGTTARTAGRLLRVTFDFWLGLCNLSN